MGSGGDSDLEIEQEEATLIELIFDTLDKNGGNLRGTAKHLNAMGYRGKTGKLFSSNTIKWIATRKLYAGIFESSVTDKVMHRPDLQIVSVDQFKRVQEFIKSRSNKGKPTGARGSYIFTGFVTCGNCRGTMVASNRGPKKVIYECVNYRMYGKEACHSSKAYSEHLILPPITEFLTDIIQEQIDIRTHLDDAASQYGKSVTEEALEAAIQGELASVQAGKERLIEAISLGILTNEEASAKLNELREQEQRLTVEVASIKEKAAIMDEWQGALEALKEQGRQGIEEQLYHLAEEKPVAFRRLLSLVFEPNSLRVRTERAQGRQWRGILEGYELTDTMREVRDDTTSFVTDR